VPTSTLPADPKEAIGSEARTTESAMSATAMSGESNLVHLNDLNWEDEVTKSNVPVLVDFTATWCGPCKVLSPIIQKLSDELAGKVKVGKLDIDESPATSAKYGIRGVPTVMVFVAGERKAQHVGLTSRENLLKLLPE
jgi:thioredoxin 1